MSNMPAKNRLRLFQVALGTANRIVAKAKRRCPVCGADNHLIDLDAAYTMHYTIASNGNVDTVNYCARLYVMLICKDCGYTALMDAGILYAKGEKWLKDGILKESDLPSINDVEIHNYVDTLPTQEHLADLLNSVEKSFKSE